MIDIVDGEIDSTRSKMFSHLVSVFSQSQILLNSCSKAINEASLFYKIIEKIQTSMNKILKICEKLMSGLYSSRQCSIIKYIQVEMNNIASICSDIMNEKEDLDILQCTMNVIAEQVNVILAQNVSIIELLNMKKQMLTFVDDYENVYKFERDHYYLARTGLQCVLIDQLNGYPVNEIKILPKTRNQAVIELCSSIEYKISPDFNRNNVIKKLVFYKDFASNYPVKTVVYGDLRSEYRYSKILKCYTTTEYLCESCILSKKVMRLKSIYGCLNESAPNFERKSLPEVRVIVFEDYTFVYDNSICAFVNANSENPMFLFHKFEYMDYQFFNTESI